MSRQCRFGNQSLQVIGFRLSVHSQRWSDPSLKKATKARKEILQRKFLDPHKSQKHFDWQKKRCGLSFWLFFDFSVCRFSRILLSTSLILEKQAYFIKLIKSAFSSLDMSSALSCVTSYVQTLFASLSFTF